MNSILNMVADCLLQQSWQITMLFVLVATGSWLLGNASSHWRYLLWCVVLAKCLLPPLVTLSLPVLPEPAPGFAEALVLPLAVTDESFVLDEKLSTTSESKTPQPSTFSENIAWPLTFKESVGLAWIAAACFFLGVMLFKGLRLQQHLKIERHELNAALTGEFKILQKQLRLKRLPPIWEIDGFGQPFVWGLWRGSIYLPRDFGETLAEKHRRGTLMHELAHVSRWDAAVNVLQILVQALFFFHPLVWWANKRIRQEREKCCDEVAIAILDAVPREYGSAILENLVGENNSRQAVPTLAVAGPVKNIEQRIKTIMNPKRRFLPKPTRMAIVTPLLLAGLAGPSALVFSVRGQDKATDLPATTADSDADLQQPATGENVGAVEVESIASKAVERATELLTEMVVGQRPRGDCSIRGKVISAATGEPVKHARMYLHYTKTYGSIFVNTASDGTFVIKDIPRGPFSLLSINTFGFQDVSYDPDGVSGEYPLFTLEENENRSGIVLKAKPAYRISGKIFNEDGKLHQNLGTLRVLAWTKKDGGGYQSKQARVLPTAGTYAIDGLDGKPVYVMAIDWRAAQKGDAYPPIYYPSTFSRDDATRITFDDESTIENIDITLKKEGGLILEGTVTDETGEPVPEAFVVVHRRDMLFDFVTAYSDQRGKYQIQGLGAGEFLVHVDAVHRGLVRTRIPIGLDRANKRMQQNFTLARGVAISGKFIDEQGNPWQIDQSHGYANITNYLNWDSNFSLTKFWNKHRPIDVKASSGGPFSTGKGQYGGGQMLFPTKSTFGIQGMMPGNTMINFFPMKEGQKVVKMLHNGRSITEWGIASKPGQEIEDVTIVIGKR